MKIKIRELLNKVLFFNKTENIVKFKITEEVKYLSIPLNTDVFVVEFSPKILSITPISGLLAGGTTFTITGTKLTGTFIITIDGVAATSINVNSDTSVTAVSPSGTVGAKNVVLTTPGGSVTAVNAFTYASIPTITTINPNTGLLAGGTSFTITGTNLLNTSSITIGGVAATSINIISSTSVTAVSPSGTAGAKNVVLTTPGGSVTAVNAFTYTNISLFPSISSINPTSGLVAGGTPFTITGNHFNTTSSVTIGGVAATNVIIISDTSVTAVSPPGIVGVQTITLTNSFATAISNNAFTYIGVPTITTINPNTGLLAGGTSFTITGTNLLNTSSITIGGVAATSINVNNDTSVTAVSPSGTAGAKNVVLTTPGGSVTAVNAFTYIGVPTITTINPNTGLLAGGTSFTITGTNLLNTSSITIGGVAATSINIISSTSVTAVSPSGTAGAKNVVLTTPGGSVTAVSAFTYIGVPTITTINPNVSLLAGGTSFTITGTNLLNTSSITIGGVAATSINIISSTSVTAVSPSGTAGAKNVVLTTPGGSVTASNAFTYTIISLFPLISSINPTSGIAAGGTSFTITGTNLLNTSSITIGGVAATSINVNNDTSVTAVSPSGTEGLQPITLTNPFATATSSNAFTYKPNLIFYDGGTGEYPWVSPYNIMSTTGRKNVQAWDNIGAKKMPFFGTQDSRWLASLNIPSGATFYKDKIGWSFTEFSSQSLRGASGINTSGFDYISKWEVDGIIEVLKLQGVTISSNDYIYFNWTEDERDFPLFPGMTGPSDNIHKKEVGLDQSSCLAIGGEWTNTKLPADCNPLLQACFTCKIPLPRAIITESNDINSAKTEKQNHRDLSKMIGKLFSDQISIGTDGSTFFGLKHYFPNSKFGIYAWPSWNYYMANGKDTLTGTNQEILNVMNIAADAYISMIETIDATDMLMPTIYSTLNHSIWNKTRSKQSVDFCNIINNKLIAQNKSKKLIIPFVSTIYNTIGTGGPYHDKKYTGVNPAGIDTSVYSQDYIPPFTIMTDNDIKFEQIDPIINAGADGATNWVSSHYRAIQTAGRNANAENEDTTPQASWRKWPIFSGPNGTPLNDGFANQESLPGYGSTNLWSDKSMHRQAVSAHLNYTNGVCMGITGNRWWWKETPGSAQQSFTPAEWKLAGGLSFNHAIPNPWNGTFVPGATSTEQTFRTAEGVYLDSIQRIINLYLTKAANP